LSRGEANFVALPFDVADGSVVVGEPVEGPNAAVAIGRAKGLCKILGHTGAVAFSRTGDPATGDYCDATVLRNRCANSGLMHRSKRRA
jgi:hypothetical protein